MARLGLLIFLFSIMSSCLARTGETVPSETKPDNQPRLKKLLSSSDRLVVKHFFPTSAVTDPAKGEFVTDGFCEFGPLIAFEPTKESSRLKGLRIAINSTYIRENAYSRPEKGESFLDIDEAKDLDNAMSFMVQTEDTWKLQRPTDDIEVTFTSKDDFEAVLFPGTGGDTLLFKNGRIGGAGVYLPVRLLGEAQTKLRNSIATLEAN